MWPSSCSPIETRIADDEDDAPRGCSSSDGHRRGSFDQVDRAADASARAQASAARTSSTVSVAASERYVVRRVQHRGRPCRTMLDEAAAGPSRKASTHDLVGGVVDRRARCRRAPPPRRARRDGRERLVVEREELPGLRPWSSRPAGAASGTRSGQARPSAIGISMVGGLACAIVEPSTNSTIECTTAGRVHDDLDPVEGDAEEQVRLDHLEPLVDQGRGVDRDDRAHVPGRVGQRLLGRDVGQLVAACGRGTGRRSR